MNCREFNESIDTLINGEAGERLTEAFGDHIASCEQCELLFDRRTQVDEAYAHFLFDIEPPKEMSAQFNRRLANLVADAPRVAFAARIATFLAPFYSRLAFAAAVLIACGIVFVSLKSEEPRQQIALQPPQSVMTPADTPRPESTKTESRPAPDEREFVPQLTGISRKQRRETRLTEGKILPQTPPKASKKAFRANETDPATAELRRFSSDTEKQIEKVELLLRSFRNARYAQERDSYDVEYEAALARRLLEQNVELRRRATLYGARLADEMLGRIEPYLYEIARLEIDPTDEEVLTIKQRVRNENIIASLQGF